MSGDVMTKQNSHTDTVERQFGDQADAYLTSAVHAQGKDLQRLAMLLQPHGDAHLLDLGCGAGHASFAAASLTQLFPMISLRRCCRWSVRRQQIKI